MGEITGDPTICQPMANNELIKVNDYNTVGTITISHLTHTQYKPQTDRPHLCNNCK